MAKARGDKGPRKEVAKKIAPPSADASPAVPRGEARRRDGQAHRHGPIMRAGLAVSPGVALGIAYCIHEIFVGPETEPLDDAQILAELTHYDRAREKTQA